MIDNIWIFNYIYPATVFTSFTMLKHIIQIHYKDAQYFDSFSCLASPNESASNDSDRIKQLLQKLNDPRHCMDADFTCHEINDA